MKIFVAGARGAIGSRLVPQLVARGHEVVGTSRTNLRASRLREQGARGVILDLLDRRAVREAVLAAEPEAIVHQATALAGGLDLKNFDRAFAETNRLRTEGTDALLEAAREAGVERFVAQSFAGWPYAREGEAVKGEDDPLDPSPVPAMRETLAAIRHLEQAVTGAGGIVLRYGGFYGAPDDAQVDLHPAECLVCDSQPLADVPPHADAVRGIDVRRRPDDREPGRAVVGEAMQRPCLVDLKLGRLPDIHAMREAADVRPELLARLAIHRQTMDLGAIDVERAGDVFGDACPPSIEPADDRRVAALLAHLGELHIDREHDLRSRRRRELHDRGLHALDEVAGVRLLVRDRGAGGHPEQVRAAAAVETRLHLGEVLVPPLVLVPKGGHEDARLAVAVGCDEGIA